MKIRRGFSSGGWMARLLDALRNLLPGRRAAPGGAGSLPPDHRFRPPGPGRASVPERVLGRLEALPLPHAFRDRRFAYVAWGVFLGTLVFGYLLAALVFFPAPIFASSRAVPRVLGLDEAAAREQLTAEGLRVGAVARTAHPTAPAGIVVWQEPPPGVVAPEATDVRLTLSDGPRRIPVPDVSGYEAEQGRLLIEAAGLKVGSTDAVQAPTPRNIVVNTRPQAGATLAPGSPVTLVVSVGGATVRVPSLRSLSLDEARLALEAAGLQLGTWFGQATDEVAPGEVFYQEPAA
ncbi:MAG TPA: PASTA domain-containing protein, partial [Gemmatimonadales bacterium]|nr:PASTA domain-containing protein [Gemmatimonadales bacterium]